MKQQGFGGVRFESQRFRLLSIVVGCFLISVTFLLSTRPESTVFDTLSPKMAWLEETRSTPVRSAVKTVKPSSSSLPRGLGRDFLVDVAPKQGDAHGRQPEQSAGEKTETEWVKDTVIIQESSAVAAERAEQEEAEQGHGADAGAGEDATPGATEEVVRDDVVRPTAAVITAPPAVETTPTPATTTRHDQDQLLPMPEGETRKAGGRMMKLHAEPATTEQHQLPTPGRLETPEPERAARDQPQQPLPPLCDFSDRRSDVCDFTGDIRMDANASSFVVVVDAATAAQSHKVRPYPRKGDQTCMGRVPEITVRTTSSSSTPPPPQCTRTHGVPAVTFSIGGYTGNIFHDFSDVLVPLYNTVHRYRGDVQLVMANVAPWWLVKYDKLLRELSRHAPLDLAAAAAKGETHCFRHAVVSLRAHRELIIERDRSPDGLATPDFTRFIRRALSLPRDAPTRLADGTGRKPRLLIIARHRTRILLNLGDMLRVAEEAGFEAAMSESDVGDPISRVGAEINSADVLVGVHGAGLTNMMFLPPGATMVQVVPWGGLQWIARMDYGDPAEAMGLRYVQYEIGVEESSLKDTYPRGHKIFTDPTSLHKKGFGFMRHTLMDGQNITLDLGRFRGVLQQALGNYLAQ
ncbi:alpha-1,3-arabinosyltransferase XAT3-like [Triticum dicoccoides]|uniref:alpha-1,3-arabinosyltransferase XAT3-like n=1 Tax=Triticum dicoccoides TaxID=85692 RepID=UPI00162C1109|nr:alpha-1,3-arabinosyltransferase XAT3-like [Triticum dicoccoides]